MSIGLLLFYYAAITIYKIYYIKEMINYMIPTR